MSLSRRDFFIGAGSAIALTACGGVTAPSRQISKIGIQTYTFRDMLAQDFRGTFQMLKDIGYDYVELNGRNYADRTPEELKAVLDDIGLPSPATHIGYGDLRDNVPGLIKTANTLGCEYVILPYIADEERSLEDWKRHASLMNASGERLADAGLKFAYHNHQFEFDDLGGGTTAMELLMNETDPRFVCFELDFFWAYLAKQDIPALFRKYPGRFHLSHVKDMKGDPDTAVGMAYETIHQELMVDVGQGDIPFAEYLALNDVSGMTYFIAEHDGPKKPYAQAAKNMYQGMKDIRF